MPEGFTLVDVGKLAKPIDTLIKKVSNATGILYEPRRIKQKALADADAAKIKALSDLEIRSIEKRALTRLVTEEIKKQENIESITEKSFESLNENSKPEDIEDDWITNFFDKCKLISDNEMQTLWSKILAGEANNPGTYSKRTIEFMTTMDKKDAELFDRIIQSCTYLGRIQPFIKCEDDFFENNNLNFDDLCHLDEIGLINFDPSSGFKLVGTNSNKNLIIRYFGRHLNLDFSKKDTINFKIGEVNLTKVGKDLVLALCPKIDTLYIENERYNDNYYHFLVSFLYKQNIILSEPLKNELIFKK